MPLRAAYSATVKPRTSWLMAASNPSQSIGRTVFMPPPAHAVYVHPYQWVWLMRLESSTCRESRGSTKCRSRDRSRQPNLQSFEPAPCELNGWFPSDYAFALCELPNGN